MKQITIVANWKSHKTVHDSRNWLQMLIIYKNKIVLPHKEVIVCPTSLALHDMKKIVKEMDVPIKLGAQNVSPFPEGAYTGEIAAVHIKEQADYVIIGHSERRELFNETDKVLQKKVALANESGLKVIYCVQGKDTAVPENVAYIAYEPVFAIGSGTPDTPENAESVAKALKERYSLPVLYGGSVNAENVSSFTSQPSIHGVLVGGASLDATEFVTMIQNA